jgi:AcrR family transcriptional regulator
METTNELGCVVGTRRSSEETREHLLQVAHDLFYRHGIRAIGVDRVAAEAGIAPTTLYRLFASKDDLVAAYVQRADEQYRTWFLEAIRADGRSTRERILGLFEALDQHLRPDRCRGCPFLMALTEFPDPELASHRHAVGQKEWVRARLAELVDELGAPPALADQLMLVLEGVYATVPALGPQGPARQARALVDAILPRG